MKAESKTRATLLIKVWPIPVSLAIVAILSVIFSVANSAYPGTKFTPPPQPKEAGIHPWETVITDLRKESDEFFASLKLVRTAIIKRAEVEDPNLIDRLYLKRPIRAGYGVLPEIVKEKPERSIKLRKSKFSLLSLSNRTKRNRAALLELSTRVSTDLNEPLLKLVKKFERLRGRLRNLERNILYHKLWQRSVIRLPRYYAGRNKLAVSIGDMMAMREKKDETERFAALRRQIHDRVFQFRKVAPGRAPTIHKTSSGSLIMPITIVTDIADEIFLNGFRASIRDLISHSAAAHKKSFSIELTFLRRHSEELYPNGHPASDRPVNRAAHLKRFGKNAYVVTTGGSSTHVYAGRAIMLGPAPISRRTLAHEFLHLVGFPDTYVRSFTGTSKDRFGVTFIEWTGLTDDIMSGPGFGRVSDEIIETLIGAYRAH